MTNNERTEWVPAAIAECSIMLADLAFRLGRPPAWLAAAVGGQEPFCPGEAAMLGESFALAGDPPRFGLDGEVLSDRCD